MKLDYNLICFSEKLLRYFSICQKKGKMSPIWFQFENADYKIVHYFFAKEVFTLDF
jgi:hypothetical protein